jgi:hypothetical protein
MVQVTCRFKSKSFALPSPFFSVVSNDWREFFGFSVPTGGNLFASVKMMKKYHIYLHPQELM